MKVYAIIDENEDITLYATELLRSQALSEMQKKMDEYNASYEQAWQEMKAYVERHPEILKSNSWGGTTPERAADILIVYNEVATIMADYGSYDIDFSKITEPYPKFEFKNVMDPECCELKEFDVITTLSGEGGGA